MEWHWSTRSSKKFWTRRLKSVNRTSSPTVTISNSDVADSLEARIEDEEVEAVGPVLVTIHLKGGKKVMKKVKIMSNK